MIIKNETTLIELNKEGLFSTRIVIAFRNAGIDDMGKLYNYVSSGKNLSNIRNLGNDSVLVVKEILRLYQPNSESLLTEDVLYMQLIDIERDCFWQAIQSVSILDEKVDAYIKSIYPKPSYLYYLLFHKYSELLEIRTGLSAEENIKFREYHVAIMEKYIKLITCKFHPKLKCCPKRDQIIQRVEKIIKVIKPKCEITSCDKTSLNHPILKCNSKSDKIVRQERNIVEDYKLKCEITFCDKTTLEECYKAGLLTIRTVHALHYAGIDDMRELYNYISSGKKLINIRHLGKKSEDEVNEILITYQPNSENLSTEEAVYMRLNKGERTCFCQAIQSVVFLLDEKVDAYIKSIYPKPSSLYYLIFHKNYEILEIRTELSEEENIMFRKYHVAIMEKYLELIKCNFYTNRNKIVQQVKNIIEDIKPKCEMLTCYEIWCYFLSDHYKNFIKERIEQLCDENLSVRANKFKNRFIRSFDVLLKLFDRPLSAYNRLCPGRHMNKTLLEIYSYNQILKKEFVHIYKSNGEVIRENDLISAFPYLSSKQRRFLIDFIDANGYKPAFYVLYNYLRVSEERVDKLYRLYHGIFDNSPRTIKELAELENLSRERIRQLLNGPIPAKKAVALEKSDLQQYGSFLSKPFICETDTDMLSIKEREHIDCDFQVFACLITLLKKFSPFYVKDNSLILVKKGLLTKVKSKKLISKLESYINSKYAKDTTINIKYIIYQNHKSIDNDIINFMTYIAKYVFKVNISHNGDILFKQNA